ncbi:WD40-repeat-containing domain protein [Mycena floridula]|nr:WD40-repeat-containing domain protein [Mycena floridula]
MMDPHSGDETSSDEDDAASQTTEEDPSLHPVKPSISHPTIPQSDSNPGKRKDREDNETEDGLPLKKERQEEGNRIGGKDRPHYSLKHTLTGHKMSISAVKFSPDGTLLASCGAEDTIKIWSPATGKLIRNLTGHTEGLSDLAWSADSVNLASGSDDKTIRIWHVDTGMATKTLRGHSAAVFCLNYNLSSNLLVSGGCDGDIRIWSVETSAGGKGKGKGNENFGKCLKTINAHVDYVTSVHFNRDASLIVSCSLDGLIRIWSTANAQCLKTLAEIATSIPQHVQFSPNSKYILSTAHDSNIRLWDYQTTRCLKTYNGHVNAKYCISACFSVTAGKWIVAGSEDGKVYIWDLQSRELVQVLEGHQDVVVAVHTHPSQNMIATGSIDKDCAIRIWTE